MSAHTLCVRHILRAEHHGLAHHPIHKKKKAKRKKEKKRVCVKVSSLVLLPEQTKEREEKISEKISGANGERIQRRREMEKRGEQWLRKNIRNIIKETRQRVSWRRGKVVLGLRVCVLWRWMVVGGVIKKRDAKEREKEMGR